MCVIQQTGTLLKRQVAVLALVWSVRAVRVHVSLQCDFSSSCVIALFTFECFFRQVREEMHLEITFQFERFSALFT